MRRGATGARANRVLMFNPPMVKQCDQWDSDIHGTGIRAETRRTGSRAARWTLTAQKVQSSGAQALSTDRKCSRMSCRGVLPSPSPANPLLFQLLPFLGRRRNEIWLVRRRDSLLTQVLTRREEVVLYGRRVSHRLHRLHAVLASLIWALVVMCKSGTPRGSARVPCGVSPNAR